MAQPETIPPFDPTPETAPGDSSINCESPEAPGGRFFDAPEQAGHLALVKSVESPQDIVGPHRPLKEGATALMPWGLSILDKKLYYGDEQVQHVSYNPYTRSETKSSLKPGSVAALEVLATSETERLTFLELRDKLGIKANQDLHDILKEISGVFEWYRLPYFTNVVDMEAEERYISLHQTPPED